ncbi:hypothetical protein J7M00_06810 [bacterium]|nr:hypothetical protein [bacterium]
MYYLLLEIRRDDITIHVYRDEMDRDMYYSTRLSDVLDSEATGTTVRVRGFNNWSAYGKVILSDEGKFTYALVNMDLTDDEFRYLLYQLVNAKKSIVLRFVSN